MKKNKNLPIIITTGEPAGIGMDICLFLLAEKKFASPIIVCACLDGLIERQQKLSAHSLTVMPIKKIATIDNKADIDKFVLKDALAEDVWDGNVMYVLDIPCATKVVAGVLDVANAPMVERQLLLAHHLAISAQISAIVTAPINKSVMIQAGICLADGSMFCGHTEFFMSQCRLDKVVMMLANQAMKVALVTTHIPLSKVAKAITKQAVAQTVEIVWHSLIAFGIHCPKILVCGLNPHAGEEGHLGDEELRIINPVLKEYQDKGLAISLALPADTLFTPKYLKDCDVVIAMYHDQGLAPLKSHGFGRTVNVTLGLPYVRTSVDHGTALDLAGTGKASYSSLLEAIKLADELGQNFQTVKR